MKSYISRRQSPDTSDSITESSIYISIEHPVSDELSLYIYILDTDTRTRYYITNFESAFDEIMNKLYKNPKMLLDLAREYPYFCRAILNGEEGGDRAAGILRKLPDYETTEEKWMLVFQIDDVRTKSLTDYLDQSRLKEVLNYVINFSDRVMFDLGEMKGAFPNGPEY